MTDIETFSIETPPGQVALRTNRPATGGSASGCLLVPGLGNDSTLYDDLLAALAGQGVTAAAIDLPGFGDSFRQPADKAYTLDMHARAAADALAALDFERIHLVLHSMAVGLSFSDALPRPDSVMLLEGNVIAEDAGWAQEIAELGDGETFDRYVSRLARHGARVMSMALKTPVADDRLAQTGGSYARMDPRAFRQTAVENLHRTRDGSYADALAGWTGLDVPVLYVRGGESPEWDGRAALDRLSVAYRELPGSAHYPMLDAPVELARIMREFQNAER